MQLLVNTTSMRLALLMLGFIALLFAARSYAQEDSDPSSRVARISYTQGSVSVQVAGTDDWIRAHINRPLTNDDQIFSDSASRAELQMGMATLHLDENTQVGILDLSDNVMQLQLNQGIINLNVRGMDNNDSVEVDTPNVSITIPEPGNYRVEVSDDATIVQVRHGSADVAGEQQRYTVQENEQLRLPGTDRLDAEFDDLNQMDDFDRWAASRNTRSHDATSARYVDDNVIGYEDLDQYGYWGWEAGYGNVWFPTSVAHGWSPYRFGHWDWISPWGWTWVDDASWGFAPFHYGRWTEVNRRWCWVPGPRNTRAVYAPALVAWIGTPGVSITASVGSSIGWIPLGPREIYRPHYTASVAYLARVNVSNSLLNREEFDRRYHNRSSNEVFVNRGAVSAVSEKTFVSAGDVRRNLMPVRPGQLHRIDNFPNLRPGKPALFGGARIVVRPPKVIERDVVAQRRPTPLAPHSGLSFPHTTRPSGSIRLIQPAPSRPIVVDAHRDNDNTERNVSPPITRGNTDNDTNNNKQNDRWDRNRGIQNQPNQSNSTNDDSHREWRNTPPDRSRPATPPPNSNQRRVNPPPSPQPQQQEPERHRIGPWVHQEQQLRSQPAPPQVHQNQPPAPRVEPPRDQQPTPPPRHDNPPPPDNRGNDHKRYSSERKDAQ